MAITETDYQHQVNALLPRGLIWKRTVGTALDAILYCLEREAARIDGRAGNVIEEADPRTSIEELERWFSDWGVPSECLKALGDPSQEQVRQELLAKITSNMGLTKAFFQSLGATLGYDTTVETYEEHDVDRTVEYALYDETWTAVMTMVVKVSGKYLTRELTVNWNVNNALAEWGETLLECVIRALAPAHVNVIFQYPDEE